MVPSSLTRWVHAVWVLVSIGAAPPFRLFGISMFRYFGKLGFWMFWNLLAEFDTRNLTARLTMWPHKLRSRTSALVSASPNSPLPLDLRTRVSFGILDSGFGPSCSGVRVVLDPRVLGSGLSWCLD